MSATTENIFEAEPLPQKKPADTCTLVARLPIKKHWQQAMTIYLGIRCLAADKSTGMAACYDYKLWDM